jgi:hypothetical protein
MRTQNGKDTNENTNAQMLYLPKGCTTIASATPDKAPAAKRTVELLLD